MADEANESNEDIPLALYPVYLYEHGFEPPKQGSYYIVTKTGIYFRKETKAGDAMVKVDGIPWLKSPSIDFRLRLPKVPARIIGQALTFFRKVFAEYKSEAYVTLMYSSKTNQYRLWCPTQTVSSGSVNYDRTDQPSFEDRSTNDWQMVGTIHSHCDFSAFHSGTDIGDEASFDGIHITLGHVNRKQISIAASVVISEVRETLEPENCCSGVVRVANKEVIKTRYMTWGDSSYFDLELSEEDAQALVADAKVIEKDWFNKVTKQRDWWDYGKKGKKGTRTDDSLFSEKDERDDWKGWQGY